MGIGSEYIVTVTGVLVLLTQPVVICLAIAQNVPAPEGVKLVLPLFSSAPPVEALYQSTVSPAPTEAEIVGTASVGQYPLSPPLTGALMTGQSQFGEVTARELTQDVAGSVTVTVILVPEGTPLIVQRLPLVLTTVPTVLLTIPVLTVTPRE